MQEFGLIKRERVANDLRRVRVSLTPASQALAAALAPRIEATYQHLESLIGVEFAERFQRSLQQLITALPLD